MKITILCDNTTTREDLIPEWGFSALIEDGDHKVLFDTGETDVYLKNAEALGKDLSDVDYVILSHAHMDHSRGFRSYAEKRTSGYKLMVNRYFYTRKYWDQDTKYVYVGNAFGQEYISEKLIDEELTSHPVTPLFDDGKMSVMSECERVNDFEKPDPVQLAWNGYDYVTDTFREEVSLVLDTDKGLVIVSGCAHVGICNIIENAKRRFGKEVYAFIGGTHFVACEFNPNRMEKSVEYLNHCGIEKICACHCTSIFGAKVLSENCPAYEAIGVGTVFEF